MASHTLLLDTKLLNKIYFDPLSEGFYQTDIHKSIPKSAIEISESTRLNLLNGQSNNKQIVVEEGKVVLVDMHVSDEAVTLYERLWRTEELRRSDIELSKVQDSDSKAVGSVADWRNYRKALRAWPENEKFPKTKFRPKAPDAE